jgi:hypothetical protein
MTELRARPCLPIGDIPDRQHQKTLTPETELPHIEFPQSRRDNSANHPPSNESFVCQTNFVARRQPRINPEVGTPVPAVTNTCSTPSTWLTEVPRNCRTPSAMPFIPWMYASPS